MLRAVVQASGLLVLTLFLCSEVFAQSELPDVSHLLIADPPTKIESRLTRTIGTVEVIVQMVDPPLAAVAGNKGKKVGFRMNGEQQRAYAAMLHSKQNNLMRSINGLGGRELARLTRAHNAVIVSVDASQVRTIASLPDVAALRLVKNYKLALSSTVPYVGAAAVQAAGVDGTGVKVAVLDSGIDYTHRNLGGAGTAAAYTAAYGVNNADSRNKTLDGLFPTAKVVAGYDFVGEVWPNGPLAPDPDPIDFEGHGTHVADIIGGRSLDGLHKGVAPGAALMAVKVCSTVSTSCSGIALLQGMDFALDPNGDGDLSDAVDVINMSLGQDYGQQEDDLSFASAIVSQLGVVVVAAAGNAADRPYIVGSPSTTAEVISVAQTQVPTATVYPLVINSPSSIAGTYGNTATVDWAPVGAGFTGNVAYVGRGCPAAGTTPADAYLADPAGKVALIDRGICSISLKVDRAAQAGAIGVLLALTAAGDAVSFAFGGGTTFVPTLVIQQSLGNSIKANISAPVNVTLSPSVSIPLVGSMASSSARGPAMSSNRIKPDIGAPGASVSAIAGSGTGEEAFGGTSGATPMVAGAAALLVQKFPTSLPEEIKARLMNSANTNVFTNPALLPGVLAPITRIGSGELRVNVASSINTAAWDEADPAAVSLSFGHYRTFGTTTYQKMVHVQNYSSSSRTYTITPFFRYASDAGGPVTLTAPPTVTVPANGSATFPLTLTLNAPVLPTWNLNGGSQGGNGPLLQTVEFDGNVRISEGGETINIPWHILPHKAANVRPLSQTVPLTAGTGSMTLTNTGGAVAGRIDVFALTGTSPQIPANELPGPGDSFALVDLKSVGVRMAAGGAIQFAINTWGERSHPNYPAEFDIFIDTNRDGTYDYVLFNLENAGFGASGQNVVGVANLTTNATIVRFFADADLGSGNMIFTALLSDMGMTASSRFDFYVLAGDNYFTGALTDAIGLSPSAPMTFQLNLPRFVAPVPTSLAINASSTVSVTSTAGGDVASPSQTGLLLMYRDAKAGVEADAILTPAMTTTTAAPASGQYSDVANLSATVSPSGLGGTVQFLVNGSPIPGAATYDSSTGVATQSYVITPGQGSYSITASFTSSNSMFTNSTGTNTLTVTLEDASVTAPSSNPQVVKVAAAGGTSGPFVLVGKVKEASDGSLGDISKAVPLTCTLAPVGPGGPISVVGTPAGVSSGVLSVNCSFTNVPVNLYEVSFAIGGNFYTGSGESVLTVYDPSLGFVTGGGTITNPVTGYPANFGLNVKFLKNGNSQGSVLYVEHRPDGDVKLKSNALGPLVLVDNQGIVTGKATLNDVGNYTFTVTAIDNGDTGADDRFGLKVNQPNGAILTNLTFNPIKVDAGNIQVPH